MGRTTTRLQILPWFGWMAVIGLASGAGYGSLPSATPIIHAVPAAAPLDTPLALSVTGLVPNDAVQMRAAATDCHGAMFESHASFTSSSTGSLDLSTAVPSSGTYNGSHAAGLLWSMLPQSGSSRGYMFCVPQGGFTVTVSALVSGKAVAVQKVVRTLGVGVNRQEERPSTAGFYGEYYAPSVSPPPRPALLVFGGSEGGFGDSPLAAETIASRGIPALALAYFHEPGLPSTLQNIPLEYFVRALTWLAAQPGVDPNRIFVSGLSRGSEAALLLGVYYPQLVHGVIAQVPNDAALCGSSPGTGCAIPAWTRGGVAVPYTRVFGDPHPPDNPDAVIPVERIQGPLLLSCGGRDAVWPSCAFAAAIQQRLTAAHFAYPSQVANYPDAGHCAGSSVPPYVPFFCYGLGGASEATLLARTDYWPKELASLGLAKLH